MGHLALYRKYRPSQLNEVSGQSAIVQTLRNEIISNRIAHAYLFSGPRGTGKTSVAKIFAKAINCINSDGNICGTCESCKQSLQNTNTDIIEIDAASNNGVDNIRALIDESKYLPQYGKYKVYIIDEVHMLSSSAFNALLKTVEDPSRNVIFIMATTELHKVPTTIVSRCQQFQFKLIDNQTIFDVISDVIAKENKDKAVYQVSVDAKEYIAKLAKGSLRDALSILDQCLAYNPVLFIDDIKNIFGEIDDTVITELSGYIEQKQIPELFDCIEEQISNGKSLNHICSSLYDFYKAKYFDTSEEEYERYMRILGELDGQMRLSSSNTKTIFEINMIKMCKPQMESDITSLALRVQELEDEIEQLKQNGIPVHKNEQEPLLPGFIRMVFPKQPKITLEVI